MSAYWGKADIVLRLWQNFSLKETIARQASLASKRCRDSARIYADFCLRASRWLPAGGRAALVWGRRGLRFRGKPPSLSQTAAKRKSISKRQNHHSLQGRWSRIHQYLPPS